MHDDVIKSNDFE